MPAPAPDQPAAAPPTHRTIAAEAGVSGMTVSLALRNHPSISTATRARVQAVARCQGYIPDPAVSRLMQHLRVRREKRLKTVIACLHPRHAGGPLLYSRLVLDGARARARDLGFALDLVSFDLNAPARTLRRTLHNRGVEALLLLPPPHPVDLDTLLDWERFCAVATTLSIRAPGLHTVLPNQFRNMLGLCRHLHAQGFHRIGLVTLEEHDQRVEHHFAAALGWFGANVGDAPAGAADARATDTRNADELAPVPVFVTPAWPPDSAALRAWVKQHRPDVIVSDSAPDLQTIFAALPARDRARLPGYATSVVGGQGGFPGIDEHPAEIGAAAVEQLAALYQRGERGPPASPRRTLIDGLLVT